MDHLFSPWRYAYVSGSRGDNRCILCRLAGGEPSEDEPSLVLQRAEHHFLVLNLFPYNCGHLMIVPFLHVSCLSDLPTASLNEMARLTARAERVLVEAYQPEGINIGMNIGQSAGAGIADHIHLHVVPRWSADTNFMTVAGETRVLPEALHETWGRLRGRF